MIPPECQVYPRSVQESRGAVLAMVTSRDGKQLFVSPPLPGFVGGKPSSNGILCPLSFANARALIQVLPWLSPQRVSSTPSFGFGDRLGLATPGHVRALQGAKVFPVLAQQSVRENTRTGRTFEDVLTQAIFGAFQEGYHTGFGADADHLKNVTDALAAAALGYTFFTCDPSDYVVEVERLAPAEIMKLFHSLPDAHRLSREYKGLEVVLDGGSKLRFGEEDLAKAAVKYSKAVAFAVEMFRALHACLPQGFDFELSVDETETLTTPLDHLFITLELRRAEVTLTCLAPRLPGAMEKGVDWRGDLAHFRRYLKAHAAIARSYGAYRLSLHSGSDKFSIYSLLAKETDGLWHVKTAGTSYLIALELVSRFSPDLFREIVRLSLSRFLEDRQSYQLSADFHRMPLLDSLLDTELPHLLDQADARQVLHVTYGSVLKSSLGEDLRHVLLNHEEDYYEALARHLGRHLVYLGVKNDDRAFR